jgi:hypothetical protein
MASDLVPRLSKFVSARCHKQPTFPSHQSRLVVLLHTDWLSGFGFKTLGGLRLQWPRPQTSWWPQASVASASNLLVASGLQWPRLQTSWWPQGFSGLGLKTPGGLRHQWLRPQKIRWPQASLRPPCTFEAEAAQVWFLDSVGWITGSLGPNDQIRCIVSF